jgi:hypothetical protein
MEHRYSERVDVDLRAAVYKRGIVVGTGRIKNGSRHGLFLQTNYDDVNVLQKLVIEVVVHLTPQQTQRYELKTIVVRKSSEGLGLELEAIGEQDSFSMSALIDSVRAMKQSSVVIPRVAMKSKVAAG